MAPRRDWDTLHWTKRKQKSRKKKRSTIKYLGLSGHPPSHGPLQCSIPAHQFVHLLLFPVAAQVVLKGWSSPSWGVCGSCTYKGMELRKGFWVLLLPQVCTHWWHPGLGQLLAPAGPCHRERGDTAVRGCLKSSVVLFLFMCFGWHPSSNVVSCQGKSPSFL